MSALLLSVRIASQSLQSIFKKKMNERCNSCEFSLSTLIACFALAYFLIFSEKFVFDSRIIPYCIAFSVCYAMASVTCVLALNCGSLALTDLMLVYSTVIPLGYSLIFCGETLGFLQIIGVAFLCVSFFFTYFKSGGSKKQKISIKWIIYAALMFLSNGMCSVIQQLQQRVFGASLDDTFMIISLIMVVVLLGISALVREGKKFLVAIRGGFLLCGLCGACNGVMNYFALLCLLVVPEAVYYPLTTAGSMLLTYLLSMVIFKERFTKRQVFGFALCVLSMIFINIK